MESLTVALPKGRLLESSAALFRRLGYDCPVDNGSRQLLVDEPEANLSYLLIRSSDVPVYVEYGAADLGIVGQDVLRESGRDVYEPLQLDFGHCRLVLASQQHTGRYQVPTSGTGAFPATRHLGRDHPPDGLRGAGSLRWPG